MSFLTTRIEQGLNGKYQGLSNGFDTLNKYILADHQKNGLPHGESKDFGAPGKCGYITYYFGDNDGCVTFVRKYLKSYSCNDGTWTAIWNDSDPGWKQSCNGSGDTCNLGSVKEFSDPADAFLGPGYTSISNKNDPFDRKYSLFPNPPGSCVTCIGDAPKTPEEIAAEAAAAAAKIAKEAQDLEDARSLSGS